MVSAGRVVHIVGNDGGVHVPEGGEKQEDWIVVTTRSEGFGQTPKGASNGEVDEEDAVVRSTEEDCETTAEGEELEWKRVGGSQRRDTTSRGSSNSTDKTGTTWGEIQGNCTQLI